jgi:hypothetical protein
MNKSLIRATLLLAATAPLFAGSFIITVNITSTNDATTIPTGTYQGAFNTNGTCTVCTVANGGITSFHVPIQTGTSVTNPAVLAFDALDPSNLNSALPQYNTATQTLSSTSNPTIVMLEQIRSGTEFRVGYPFFVLMEMTPTTLNTPPTTCDSQDTVRTGCVSINPVEETLTQGTYTFTTSSVSPPPPCVLSQLGAAGSFSILGLSGAQVTVQSSLPGGGSVGIGASGKLHIQGNTTLNSAVYADPSATIQLDGGSSITGTSTAESFTVIQNAAVTEAAAFAALTPTQTFSQQIQSATAIMGNGGQNVISITNQVNLNNGQNLTISGGPNDTFIFNIAQGQNFNLQNGASIVLSGVAPSQVVFNFVGNGANVQTNNGNTAGIFLDPQGQIQIQGGTHNSVFISGNQINIQNSPTVNPITCPGPTPLSLSCPVRSGTVGTSYSSALVAIGGVSPYTYSIASGSIAPLSLNSTTGAITGTPTAPGTLSFTGEVVDSSGNAVVNTMTEACSIDLTTTPPYACQIPPSQTIISGTSWNRFNTQGSPNYVWVNAHIGGASGLSTTTKTTLDFTGVTFTAGPNGTQYGMPDGLLIFDPAAPATPTTTFDPTFGTNGRWTTTFNPNDLSDEIFFVGNAILVDSNVSNGGQANFSYTVNSTDPAFAYNWQWSAAVFTYWPATKANQPDTGNNGAQIQPYHGGSGGYHAGTPLNTTVQQSLIQGPRGGGGSNFTGSWSATAGANCVGDPYP